MKCLINFCNERPKWKSPLGDNLKDNGRKYTSTKFEDYLKADGVHHERTVPKTPE